MVARRRIVIATVAISAIALLAPSVALAAEDDLYTLPFYKYKTMTQAYGPTSYTGEPAGHGYAHWHNGIDWSMSIGTNVAASRKGTTGNYKEDLVDGQGPDQYGQGNYLFVSHDGNRWSLYYHLTQNGVLVSGDVSAGKHIAESGNTGYSSGPHLHYSLMTTGTCQTNACDTSPNLWTTNSARIPFEANYYSESNAGTEDICYGATITHWVKFKNTGGRTWKPTDDEYGHGRIVLRPVNSSGTTAISSQFAAADWESSSTVGPADQASVPPYQSAGDVIGKFTFGLKGIGTEGNYYTVRFNIWAKDLKWFNYVEIGSYYIPIFIVPHQAC